MKTLADTRKTALNLLARREHSVFELKRKLLVKGFNEQDITVTLKALAEENLQSNQRFVESYVHHRRQKGYGPVRILAELLGRGLTEDVIDHHLNMSDNAWFAEVRHLWQKRFKGTLPRDSKTRAKQMRFLQYRGFTPEQINYIYSDESE